MKKIYLLLLLFLIIFIIILLSLVSKKPNGEQPGSFVTPTPVEVNSKGDAVGGVRIPSDPAAIEEDRRSSLVSQLIHKTPYKGSDFSFSYDFRKDLFTLYINPSNKQLGRAEFGAFLKTNGVEDISWIDNLFITYIPPVIPTQIPTTPAP